MKMNAWERLGPRPKALNQVKIASLVRVCHGVPRQEPAPLDRGQSCHGLKIQIDSLEEGRSHFPLRVAAYGDVQIDGHYPFEWS